MFRLPFVNQNGIAILDSTSVSVGTEAVTVSFSESSNRWVPTRGLVLVDLVSAIPAGTTDTLPIVFSMNGFTANVTTYNGENWTVADVAGTGFYLLYYDRWKNILQVLN